MAVLMRLRVLVVVVLVVAALVQVLTQRPHKSQELQIEVVAVAAEVYNLGHQARLEAQVL